MHTEKDLFLFCCYFERGQGMSCYVAQGDLELFLEQGF